MTNMELVLNMLAETSSAEISKSTNAQGVKGVEQSVIKGGNIARIAKEQLEKETGKITSIIVPGSNKVLNILHLVIKSKFHGKILSA